MRIELIGKIGERKDESEKVMVLESDEVFGVNKILVSIGIDKEVICRAYFSKRELIDALKALD